MDSLEFDHALFQNKGAGDDKLYVQFYNGVTLDTAATIEAGRPIHRDEVYIKIIVPGDKTNIVERPVRDTDKARFPKHWAAFKQGAEGDAQTVGTRLKEWSLIPRSLAEDLGAVKIFTVEQLATVRDDVLSSMPGLRQFKDAAAAWLDQAKTTAEASKLAAAMEQKDAEIGALNEALRDLQAQVTEMRKTRGKAAA